MQKVEERTNSFMNGDYCDNGCSLKQQLDQLKAENDLYKNAHKTEQDRRRSYENALTEIKEIAEPFCETCQKFEPEKKNRNNIYCRFCNYGKILQKISEVEDVNI